jgi:hypothetical protein
MNFSSKIRWYTLRFSGSCASDRTEKANVSWLPGWLGPAPCLSLLPPREKKADFEGQRSF